MAIQTFPASPKPAYGISTTQKHRTLISGMASGGELRRRSVRFPKRNISLAYNYLSASDRDIIQSFFTDRGGPFEEFWFVDYQSKHRHDEYVGRGGPINLIGAMQYNFSSGYTSQFEAARNETIDDMDLFANPPMLNDCYYFGSPTQFDNLHLIISAGGAGTWTITYEYWNGAWTALAGVTDDTNHFKNGSEGSYPDLFDDVDWDSNDLEQADISEAIRLAFERNVTFTVPIDWAIYEVDGINAYWIRARISALTAWTILPKGASARINSKTYELHGITTSGVSIYVDGTLKTAGGVDYTLVVGGGAGGADRILFVSYPTTGDLITSNFTGYLRIKARFADDELSETEDYLGIFSLKTNLQEVQW